MKQPKRFEKIFSPSMGSMEIRVDKETGVNYLYRNGGYGGDLTPLYDRDGKIVVTPVLNKN